MNRYPIVQRLVAALRRQAHRFRTDERGETTEKVIITALFAALALTVATIITLKVTDKAVDVCPVGAILRKRVGFVTPIGQRRFDESPISAQAIADAPRPLERHHD